MLKNSTIKILALFIFTFPVSVSAFGGISGNFDIGVGPVKLGGAIMYSDCKGTICNYSAHAEGSFLFVDADILEEGTYQQIESQVVPVSTSYEEKIGSKHKTVDYDFSAKEMLYRKSKNKSQKRKAIPDNAYPFIPLLNQVALDITHKGPKEYYEYLQKHKIKRATLTKHSQKQTENGTLHYIVIDKKDTPLEFYLVQNGNNVHLKKFHYGKFWMERKN